MIKSMTGFGRGEASAGGVRATVELRSVNHRFADLKIRVPPELAEVEPQLQQTLQRSIGRGRVEVSVSMARDGAPAPSFDINRGLVASYVEAARSLRQEFGLHGDVSLEGVLSLPDVVRPKSSHRTADPEERRALVEAFDRAVSAHDAMRRKEGRILVRDVRARAAAMKKLSASIARRARRVPALYARRLEGRVRELLRPAANKKQPLPIEASRLAQEVALLAERSDITEELVRFDGYLEQLGELLDAPAEPIGKKLDFIMQEMNREANTINSKAVDLAICQAAIEMKAEVEKIREQVQNIE
ncbi:MAG TPA: YicC/YloC family endoribonuclease [Candidatus Polarisedimenticolia bacterium]|nr:YicC/YloC family endoribonuclease [Candidatus Polarisedimenticolia bacterium]